MLIMYDIKVYKQTIWRGFCMRHEKRCAGALHIPLLIFSRKITKSSHPGISFNNMPVFCVNFQKHLGLCLDEKVNFNYHIKEKISKAMQGLGVIKKISNILTWNSLITIDKSFVRPLLDYGDVLYDQPNNESLCQKIESA